MWVFILICWSVNVSNSAYSSSVTANTRICDNIALSVGVAALIVIS